MGVLSEMNKQLFINLVGAGMRFRKTPIVDDYFTHYRDVFDSLLQVASNELQNEKAEMYSLDFNTFRIANVTRCLKWHPNGIESWSSSDWLTAIAGELGELASLIKMRNRERDGLVGNKFHPTDKQIADEIADVLTYLDLLAASLHIDLGMATIVKFNEVSARNGFSDALGLKL